MSNEQQEMIVCECCGKRVESYEIRTVDTKNLGKKQICIVCFNNRLCKICNKLDINHNEIFEKFNGLRVCSHCVQEKVDLCKKHLTGFIEYTKQFYSKEKRGPYYCKADSQNIENYIKKNNNFKEIVEDAAIGWGQLTDKDGRSLFFKLFTDLVGDNFDNINILSAHWNDFLASSQELPFKYESVVVKGGCKHCGRSIFIENGSNKKFYVFFDNEKVYDTAYNLYLKVKNDPNYKCQHCIAWLDIIGSLRQKFGWNPKWRVALNEFEKFGKRSHGQADPNDFYRILTANEIVMSQQVVDAWNAIYEKRDGDCIIKCYAVPDSPRAQVEQTVSRAADGVLKGLRKLFG